MCNAIPPYVQCRCPHCRFGALRVLTSGTLWPMGRNAARDAAQVRIFQRALAGTEESAA